jgi:hypothetical protein
MADVDADLDSIREGLVALDELHRSNVKPNQEALFVASDKAREQLNKVQVQLEGTVRTFQLSMHIVVALYFV